MHDILQTYDGGEFNNKEIKVFLNNQKVNKIQVFNIDSRLDWIQMHLDS